MSKFEKELCRSKSVINASDEIDKDQADSGLLLRAICNKFKDWQPPKKLVEVPQFVADFIEEGKEEFKLYGAFFEIEKGYSPGTELYNWVFQKLNGQSLFARAWIDGYTVKKEQLYEVVFYVDEEDDRCLLMKTGKTISFEYESQNEGHYQQQFTEAEIKEIDERYWAFAVEVDK